jgi:YidC/Oxa1 family membrane protein insertase
MADNRNMFLAIALSLAIILGWQFLVIEPRLEAEREAQRQAEQRAEQTTETPAPTATQSTAQIPAAPQPAQGDLPQPSATPQTSETATAPTATAPRVPFDTPSIDGSISLIGARIDDLSLKEYHVTVDPESPEVRILSPVGTPNPYFVETGWVAAGEGVAVPQSDTQWTLAEGDILTPDTPVTLTWDNGEGLIFRRTIEVDEKYMFTVRQAVENTTGEAVTLFPYSRVRRQGTPETTGFWILHEGMIGVLGEEGLVQEGYGGLQDAGVMDLPRSEDGWLGITDKYWATAVIPDPGTSFQPRYVYASPSGVPAYQADYLGGGLEIAPGGTVENTARVFAGAKETNIVQGYEDTYGIDRFNLLIDWGWFYFITKPLFYALDWVHGLVGNFGVAILVVTVGIKLVFFPLASKAYASMAKMKALQPKIQQMRERYKDDRMKQQQEMMELYKKEKVNPLAGCIPILIQIPVFFALYKVLFVSIEMRHAPFFGWINDLSAPDPTSVFNLFGLLPFEPAAIPVIGAFLMVGVWPLIMGITMWVQMKMNPAPPDPTQAMIFNWMPILFTFLLASFPAGLVIYWAWNNFLSVMQQWVIMRRHGVKVELWDNITSLFRGKQKGAT